MKLSGTFFYFGYVRQPKAHDFFWALALVLTDTLTVGGLLELSN